VLAIPRIPTNLIAYSIGGEKVYKTGESLLSTPLHIRPVFLAKCAIPVLVSAIMLLTSALLTLMGVNMISWILPDIGKVYRYTDSQLVLIFAVGIMASMMMMFISAILSAILKTPRHGLFATSLISFLFVIPVLPIVYLTQNTFMWSLIYFAILLIGNIVCIWNISDKISRPQIMSWL
jgi:ABC-type Na+ efflux pump permease subunit